MGDIMFKIKTLMEFVRGNGIRFEAIRKPFAEWPIMQRFSNRDASLHRELHNF